VTEAVPLLPGGLPRVSARDVAGAWLAMRLLARLPRRLEVTLGTFDKVELVYDGPRTRGAFRGDHVVFGLARGLSVDASSDTSSDTSSSASSAASSGRSVGRLAVEGALASQIVAVALGAEVGAPSSIGRLGVGARGVVAGFVAGVLDALGAPLVLSLAPCDGAAPPGVDAVKIGIRVTAARREGWAELEVPGGWLTEAAQLPLDPAELGALEVEVAVELGRTSLSAGALAGLEAGDAVVFDGECALAVAVGTDWPARVVLGDFAADAAVSVAGDVSLARGFRQTRARAALDGTLWSEELSMETRAQDRQAKEEDNANRGDTTVLAAAPIEVVAELGRFTLRGDEVLGLGPGTVLTLGRARGTAVALRVGGEIWAEGELVDVEGELAVRVTRSSRPPSRAG
jgi:type III secretion system YscQ/HrcQ family protein